MTIPVASSKELLECANILYEFIDLFSNYENTPRDYGFGNLLSMSEIHILSAIDNHPGITATELAEQFRRSKSFISQTIAVLRGHSYILRFSTEKDAKKKQLFVSPEGKQLCQAHAAFDEHALTKTYSYLLRDCTPDEIDAFYNVMGVYNNIMKAADRKRKRQAAG